MSKNYVLYTSSFVCDSPNLKVKPPIVDYEYGGQPSPVEVQLLKLTGTPEEIFKQGVANIAYMVAMAKSNDEAMSSEDFYKEVDKLYKSIQDE